MEEKKLEQTYAIELKNITKRFGKIVANDGINLQVKRGEILSLLGEKRKWEDHLDEYDFRNLFSR